MNRSSTPSLRVNTSFLWQVTLGFLPAYVNLHKRLYPENEPQEEGGNERSSSIRESPETLSSVFVDEDVPDAEMSDISDSESGSVMTESGWSTGADSDVTYPSDEATKDKDEGSVRSGVTMSSGYSNSFYDFARTPSTNGEKKGKHGKVSGCSSGSDDRRWNEQFSEAVFGTTDCQTV